MSGADRHPITFAPVRYAVEGMDAVVVRRDVAYGSDAARSLTFDVYEPISRRDPAAVVVLVTGYPDVGVARRLGCAFKDMAMWTSLGRILAASGLAAVGYTSAHPDQDIDAVLHYLGEHAPSLGVDADRIGLWATSGHVPAALGALARHSSKTIRAAVLSTGYTVDMDGSIVADAGRRYGFAVPEVTFGELPSDVPVFLARAGRDENDGLNHTLDRLVAAALRANWPMTLVNLSDAGHAFELTDDGPTTGYAIDQMLAFLRFWLRVRPPHR
jgi:hypothetical protein